MAQKVTMNLVDDLTGDIIEDGGRTVAFSFDGSHYEIDLSDENAERLRAVFADYIAAGRKVTGRAGRKVSGNPARRDTGELAKVREWAAGAGYDVAPRGRISQSVMDAYTAAH